MNYESPKAEDPLLNPEADYSPEFKEWINDDEKLRELLEGSCIHNEPWDKKEAWEKWKKRRGAITQTINKSGAILDYGCANGFLLRCLQEWSSHQLEPYGVDTEKDMIKKAKELFPNQQDHFALPEETRGQNFPSQFDFIYWNVWDNWEFETPKEMELFKILREKTANDGRLILGLYDTKKENDRALQTLKNQGFEPAHVMEETVEMDDDEQSQLLAVFENKKNNS